MTEVEWLACVDPRAMVTALREYPRASPRVWRLFLAAYWGWQVQNLDSQRDKRKLRKRAGLIAGWAESGKKPVGVTRDEQSKVIFFHRSPSTGAVTTARYAVSNQSRVDTQIAYLRDIFGNPFRPVALNPAWLTSDVLALARGIYDERAFERMPILADALQDAGCDNADILTHCRDAKQVHVRGCWVLDLLLGKT